MSYYTVIVKTFLVPLLMIIFGLLTVRNIRSVRRVTVAPASMLTGTAVRSGGIQSSFSKDRQFFIILAIDIVVYMICSSTLSAVYLYDLITQYNVESSFATQFDLSFRNMAIFLNYISVCIGCYTNFFISKTFRNEIKNIFFCR
jgi:hypothetical protein